MSGNTIGNSVFYIDCRVANYQESPYRVIAEYDMQNSVLRITSNEKPYKPKKTSNKGLPQDVIDLKNRVKKATLVVVDVPNAFDSYDLLFIEKEHLNEAIQAYTNLKATGQLLDDLGVDLANLIQVKEVNARGREFVLNDDDATNKTMAVLLCCWAGERMANNLSAHRNSDDTQSSDEDMDAPFSI